MGATSTYNNLALRWNPASRIDHRFNLIVAITLGIALIVAVVLSSVELPPQVRKAHTPVPERIAKFILEKEKPKVVKPKPKPLPKPKPKPRVRKKPPRSDKLKPLTKELKKAREKAKESGLMALAEELGELLDTSSLTDRLGAKTTGANKKASSLNLAALSKDATKGSGGVNSGKYAMGLGATRLSNTQLRKFRESLLAGYSIKTKSPTKSKASNRLAEYVYLVLDQNKSKLHSLYNRARRKNPSLKGKIILEITINSIGKVTKIKILDSELNDAHLEQRIVSRIKQIDFGKSGEETITVRFPIEFLPS